MELISEKFGKKNFPINIIFFIFLTYFLIPGGIDINLNYIIFKAEIIFLFISTIATIYLIKKYGELNKNQNELLKIINQIILIFYICNLLFFILINKNNFNYILLSYLNSYFLFFSIINISLIIFFFNNKNIIILNFIYLTGIIIVLEFFFFIILILGEFKLLEILYKNFIFINNDREYLLFRSIFFGDHITTSFWSFLTFIVILKKKRKLYYDYFFLILLFVISCLNYESRLNIANIVFISLILILLRIFKKEYNLKDFYFTIFFYFIFSILISILIQNFIPGYLNLNTFFDRLILNVYNIDTYLNFPLSLGFDGLRFHYDLNKNIFLKKIIFYLNHNSQAIGTISSLGDDQYFHYWKTITSPHNILMLYLTSMGIWFVLIVKYFLKYAKNNFYLKNEFLILLTSIIIFSFWNDIRNIDLIFVVIITLIIQSGIKNENK